MGNQNLTLEQQVAKVKKDYPPVATHFYLVPRLGLPSEITLALMKEHDLKPKDYINVLNRYVDDEPIWEYTADMAVLFLTSKNLRVMNSMETHNLFNTLLYYYQFNETQVVKLFKAVDRVMGNMSHYNPTVTSTMDVLMLLFLMQKHLPVEYKNHIVTNYYVQLLNEMSFVSMYMNRIAPVKGVAPFERYRWENVPAEFLVNYVFTGRDCSLLNEWKTLNPDLWKHKLAEVYSGGDAKALQESLTVPLEWLETMVKETAVPDLAARFANHWNINRKDLSQFS